MLIDTTGRVTGESRGCKCHEGGGRVIWRRNTMMVFVAMHFAVAFQPTGGWSSDSDSMGHSESDILRTHGAIFLGGSQAPAAIKEH